MVHSLFSVAVLLAQVIPTGDAGIPVGASAQTPMPQPLMAQAMVKPAETVRKQSVRPLSGRLDAVPVFNRNSPELVLQSGILLSTFPGKGKAMPQAHLNFRFDGRFDLFAHHVAKAPTPEDLRTLYLGIVLYNPTARPVTVNTLQGASYLSQPDAPFRQLPAQVDATPEPIFAGPGSRITGEVLRGQRQADLPAQVVVPAGEYVLFFNRPIPVRSLDPPLNGRSTLMRLQSDGPLYAASLAQFAERNEAGEDQAPTLAEWVSLLQTGELSTPRDRPPTPLDTSGKLIYGRVAGVSQGSRWQAYLTDSRDAQSLTIPEVEQAISYGLSTLVGGTYGTKQVQAATMLARYPDTAYQSHGNYGVEYNLTLPLHNPSSETRTVTLTVETPLKDEQAATEGLRFLDPPGPQVWFRGMVRIRFNDDQGLPQTRYVHLVQTRGQQAKPMVTLTMPAGDRRFVTVDFLYPPDSTPPQVLTIRTQG